MKILYYFNRCFATIRPESAKLRKYLLEKYKKHSYGCHCSMCLYVFPECLLHAAHLKPRNTMSSTELLDFNNVELMCNLCHSLYDYGHISVNYNSEIILNPLLLKFNHLSIINKVGTLYSKYNSENSKFLEWHYENIFLK